jgi:hypothetical protein
MSQSRREQYIPTSMDSSELTPHVLPPRQVTFVRPLRFIAPIVAGASIDRRTIRPV